MGTVLFIVSIILAIPTFGASLLIFFIVDGIILVKASDELRAQLAIAYNNNESHEVTSNRKGAVKYLFKKYGIDGFEEKNFPNGTDSFHGDLLIPEIPKKFFASIIRNRSDGFTTLSAKTITEFERPVGATAKETVDQFMDYLKSKRQ